MEEHAKTGQVGLAAMKAGMDRKTARKYIQEGKLPSQLKKPRGWRTRADPFVEDWDEVAAMLAQAPELQAKALFEHLMATTQRYDPGQLRTFQRRVRRWRAQHGPDKEVFFPQVHRPGEAMQTDFTWCTELGVTIAGEAFAHLLCHLVLPYSNWEAVSICHSESMAALRDGVQNAVFRLGRIPEWHQTDNSTAATHDLPSGKRGFNASYQDFMDHLGMKPRTIAVGKKQQNGDVESLNNALKNRIRQHLLLRGSSDFASVEAYRTWLQDIVDAANALREKRFAEDLAAMRPLVAKRLLAYTVDEVRVSSWSTIRVLHNAYSLPSRLIGEKVRVHLYEDRLQVWYNGTLQAEMERLTGRHGHIVDYRHVVFWLSRKPGAFARYKYREAMFPTLAFRQAYDALLDVMSERKGTMEYLRLLHFAATTMECEVDLALQLLADQGELPTLTAVQQLTHRVPTPASPDIAPYEPDLRSYDKLVGGAS